MASNIQSESIDGTFPVAGVDNDTQGFRDNFGYIKSNFAAAKEEIELLQNETVKLTENNNFAGTYIIDANMQAVTGKTFDIGYEPDQAVVPEINFEFGHYQQLDVDLSTFTESGGFKTATFKIVGFPPGASSGGDNEDRFAKFTLQINSLDTSADNWRINFTNDAENTHFSPNYPSPFVLPSGVDYGPTIIEFWSANGGVDIFVNYLGRFK